ncbi:MAG: HAD family hydrolase [Chthoniobacterales bacterium]
MALTIPKDFFKAYIFDCDGTLADTMPLHYRAWKKAVGEHGGDFPEDLFYSWGGRPTIVIVNELNERFGLKMPPEETVRRKENYYLELIPEVKPVPPVVELMHRYHGTAPLAVASGGHRELVEATLNSLGLVKYFDTMVCAEDYVHGKPSPEPFLLAAKRMGVEPQDCLVFEDGQLGVDAAVAAGMQYVFVPTPAPQE